MEDLKKNPRPLAFHPALVDGVALAHCLLCYAEHYKVSRKMAQAEK
jgi:hypothetical protein